MGSVCALLWGGSREYGRWLRPGGPPPRVTPRSINTRGSSVWILTRRWPHSQASLSARTTMRGAVAAKASNGSKVVMMGKFDRWAGMGDDMADQQDTTRGRGMTDPLFQVHNPSWQVGRTVRCLLPQLFTDTASRACVACRGARARREPTTRLCRRTTTSRRASRRSPSYATPCSLLLVRYQIGEWSRRRRRRWAARSAEIVIVIVIGLLFPPPSCSSSD
jgi:hypothetical protein